VEFLVELFVPNLFQNVGVTSLINFEGLLAMGADDFIHVHFLFVVIFYSKSVRPVARWTLLPMAISNAS
jgi:hypothetical protein